MTRINVETEFLDESPGPGGRLGRHVEHDPRSKSYAITGPAAPLVREPIMWDRFSAILDQGELGSCTGNAMAGWLGCFPHVDSVEAAVPFDEELAVELYRDATRLDPFPGSWPPNDTGSSGLAVAKAAKRRGLIAGYGWAFTTDALVLALQIAPVIVGVPWFAGFDRPDDKGLVKATGPIRGGHEFLIRGWTPDPNGEGSQGLLHADNSWGTRWGVRGSFCFTTATWDKLRRNRADVTVPKLS